MPKDKLKVFQSLHAELRNELAELESRANAIRSALDGKGEAPSAIRRGRPAKVKRLKSGRKITTNDAILTALSSGQLGVPEIVEKVNAFKGKVSKAGVNQGLMQLKKKGAIVSPARGQYKLKK